MTKPSTQSSTPPDFFRVDVADMRIPGLNDALEIWRAKCHGDDPPVWGDGPGELYFTDMANDLIPVMMLVDIDHEPGFGSYRFWGSRVASADGRDMTGLRICDLAPSRHAQYSEEQYRWVVSHGEPALFVACLGEKSWNRKYEAVLRMPCRSAPGSNIDRVFCIGHYDDVRQKIEDYIDTDVDLHNYIDPDADKLI